jgi:hypothetical protein
MRLPAQCAWPRKSATSGKIVRAVRQRTNLPSAVHDAFDPQTITRIRELLQSGEQVVTSGSSRWSKTLLWRSGQFFFDTFDEGSSYETPASEQDFSAALAEAPGAFHELLARPAWRRFFAAFVDGDRAQARAALHATRHLPGNPERYRYVFEAVLDWPEQAPAPERLAQLKELVRGGLAVHPFRSASYGRDDPATTRRAIAYLTTLGDITGWPRLIHGQRADFHERLGDLRAALDDCLQERKLEPNPSLAERIQKLQRAVRRDSRAR